MSDIIASPRLDFRFSCIIFTAVSQTMKLSSFHAFRSLRILPILAMITALCGCETARMAFEGNPMPQEQVASYLEVVSPRSAYDTPPKFIKGYAPFFPEAESRKRHVGYALAEFTIQPDGRVTHIRILKATTYNFAEEAGYTVRDWTFAPAKKNGQAVAVRARLPFTFRET
jgi:TonB family protein